MANKNKGLIFQKSFKAPPESDIYKSCMEYGVSDPTLKDFTPVWMMRANKDDKRSANDGTKVRYATNKDGNYTHENFEWVNCVLLSKSLDSFIDSLRSIDYEYVLMAKKKEGK